MTTTTILFGIIHVLSGFLVILLPNWIALTLEEKVETFTPQDDVFQARLLRVSATMSLFFGLIVFILRWLIIYRLQPINYHGIVYLFPSIWWFLIGFIISLVLIFEVEKIHFVRYLPHLIIFTILLIGFFVWWE